MAKDWIDVVRYLISPEESRLGRKDYWNSVFLAEKTPINRTCLEIFKILVLMIMSISLMMALVRL